MILKVKISLILKVKGKNWPYFRSKNFNIILKDKIVLILKVKI
jgi:hypothetical protein